MTKAFVLYTSDDGNVVCALELDLDTIAVMGFTLAPPNTPRQPQYFLTRKQVFRNTSGETLRLPYPSVGYPYTFGFLTIRGDPTYVAIGSLAERNKGEST